MRYFKAISQNEGPQVSYFVGFKAEQPRLLRFMVPKAGLEPARPLRRGILNPLRLPFRHLGIEDDISAALTRRPEAKHA